MKKIVVTLALCVMVARPCLAQNNMEAMRFLTINALMSYGQKLYERGDFDEASAVFNHVLTYDGHQSQALEYLKEMGHSPVPVLTTTVDILDNESLKRAIEAKKQSIEKLRAQIKQLRANIAIESAKE